MFIKICFYLFGPLFVCQRNTFEQKFEPLSSLDWTVVEIENSDLPERRVRHEAGGVLKKQELAKALPGLKVAPVRARTFLELIGVMQKVEEVGGKPAVVQRRAQLAHHLRSKIRGRDKAWKFYLIQKEIKE